MYIALETGGVVEGRGIGGDMVSTELVFTTAYTGYEESMTDPSYNGQGLIFAYPLIGNYGVDERRFESSEVQPDVVIARKFTDELREWLRTSDTVGVEHVDSRAIVTKIRERGSLRAGIASSQSAAHWLCDEAVTNGITMRHEPRDDLPELYNPRGSPTIAMLDCGVKRSMIERLVDRGAEVVRYPWDVDAKRVRALDPDLLFVSNGPGDPASYGEAIALVKSLEDDIPVAGICLGQQIIALALGGDTRKMKFGHRGSNQPLLRENNQVVMSTANHGYVVSDVPESIEVVETNVNDCSIEGLRRKGRKPPIRSIQHHPEGNPGPNDMGYWFEEVYEMTKRFK